MDNSYFDGGSTVVKRDDRTHTGVDGVKFKQRNGDHFRHNQVTSLSRHGSQPNCPNLTIRCV